MSRPRRRSRWTSLTKNERGFRRSRRLVAVVGEQQQRAVVVDGSEAVFGGTERDAIDASVGTAVLRELLAGLGPHRDNAGAGDGSDDRAIAAERCAVYPVAIASGKIHERLAGDGPETR